MPPASVSYCKGSFAQRGGNIPEDEVAHGTQDSDDADPPNRYREHFPPPQPVVLGFPFSSRVRGSPLSAFAAWTNSVPGSLSSTVMPSSAVFIHERTTAKAATVVRRRRAIFWVAHGAILPEGRRNNNYTILSVTQSKCYGIPASKRGGKAYHRLSVNIVVRSFCIDWTRRLRFCYSSA